MGTAAARQPPALELGALDPAAVLVHDAPAQARRRTQDEVDVAGDAARLDLERLAERGEVAVAVDGDAVGSGLDVLDQEAPARVGLGLALERRRGVVRDAHAR